MFRFDSLERRSLLANVSWDGGGGGDGINWSDAANWSGDVLPRPADNVQIAATTPVTVAGVDVQVSTVNGGKLVVNSPLKISTSGNVTSLTLGLTGHFGGAGNGVVTTDSCAVSAGSLTLARLTSIAGGVLQSGTLSLGGELVLGDAPPIVTNRGNITLTGPSGKLASLATLTRNEGSLAVNGAFDFS